jgi:hypothetical protein
VLGMPQPPGGSPPHACISRIMTPRDRSPFTAGKMGAGRTKTREIPHARHDFPHYCWKIQLLMANPSTCAGLRRNLAENPAPYRTIPHGWAFCPQLTTGTIALASLTVGAKFSIGAVPRGVLRYLRLAYTVTGSAPSTGKVTAGVAVDGANQDTAIYADAL